MISVFTSNLDKRGSTQWEALATHSVEKNLELILPIVNPPKLVPKWPYWWGLSSGTSFDQIWYYYEGADEGFSAEKEPNFGVVKLDTQL